MICLIKYREGKYRIYSNPISLSADFVLKRGQQEKYSTVSICNKQICHGLLDFPKGSI